MIGELDTNIQISHKIEIKGDQYIITNGLLLIEPLLRSKHTSIDKILTLPNKK